MATGGGVPVKPATKEELDAFLVQNKRWLPDEAEQILRGMSPLDQRRVIGAGTMSSVRDPTAVIQARVRKARELETQMGRGQSVGPAPLGMIGDESRISKPATREELDTFIRANERWLQGEAAEILRAMTAVDQKRVISAGTLSGCRDPVAVIQTRAKKAREMELELETLSNGQRQPAQPDPPPAPPPPDFCEAAAALHLFAPPEVVTKQESKFAPPPSLVTDGAEGLIGQERGIGGVVEIIKAKYGCGKGQRLRVIGETPHLLQFEGGKTAPKNQEDKGWRWVLREEEESKAVKAQEEGQEVGTTARVADRKATGKPAKNKAKEPPPSSSDSESDSSATTEKPAKKSTKKVVKAKAVPGGSSSSSSNESLAEDSSSSEESSNESSSSEKDDDRKPKTKQAAADAKKKKTPGKPSEKAKVGEGKAAKAKVQEKKSKVVKQVKKEAKEDKVKEEKKKPAKSDSDDSSSPPAKAKKLSKAEAVKEEKATKKKVAVQKKAKPKVELPSSSDDDVEIAAKAKRARSSDSSGDAGASSSPQAKKRPVKKKLKAAPKEKAKKKKEEGEKGRAKTKKKAKSSSSSAASSSSGSSSS